MEALAKTTIRQSAKKVRFVLEEVRNASVNDALAKLNFINKKAAKNIHKTILMMWLMIRLIKKLMLFKTFIILNRNKNYWMLVNKDLKLLFLL